MFIHTTNDNSKGNSLRITNVCIAAPVHAMRERDLGSQLDYKNVKNSITHLLIQLIGLDLVICVCFASI